MQKQDNSTFIEKTRLRKAMLKMADNPIICETHGGYGAIYSKCYKHIMQGIVFETKNEKANHLAHQRPTWAVYQSDCVPLLDAGIGNHLEINVFDVDPYGDSWPVIESIFNSLSDNRPRPDRVFIVVNDGMRHKINLGGAWSTGSLSEAVRVFGNNLGEHYIEVCKFLMQARATSADYQIVNFHGYYCGSGQRMTHFLAICEPV
jgi:hypothetical protein